jgi:hypothetical protein
VKDDLRPRPRWIGPSKHRKARFAEPRWVAAIKELAFSKGVENYEKALGGGEERSRRGRPVDPKTKFRNQRIAAHTFLLELEGPTEAVVAAIRDLYQVTRSTVFAACRQWPQLRDYADQVPPEQRRHEIESLERTCLRRPKSK